jgi:hypothetical protein
VVVRSLDVWRPLRPAAAAIAMARAITSALLGEGPPTGSDFHMSITASGLHGRSTGEISFSLSFVMILRSVVWRDSTQPPIEKPL